MKTNIQYFLCITILLSVSSTKAACGILERQQSILVTRPVELTIKNNTHHLIQVNVDNIIQLQPIQAHGYLKRMWAIPYACRITRTSGLPGYQGYHTGADNRDLHIQIIDFSETVLDFYVNPVCGHLDGPLPDGKCASITTYPTPQTQKSRFYADVETHNTAITVQIKQTVYD